MAKKKNYEYVGISMPLVVVTAILTLIGIVMVLSSTYNMSLISSDEGEYLGTIASQGVAAAGGFIVMLFLGRLDYHILKNKKCLLVAFVIVGGMLLWALFDKPVNKAHRWIWLGDSFSFQPSEFAKFLAVICAARYVAYKKEWYKKKESFLALAVPVGGLAALVIIEPDLSTTMCLLGAVVVVLFVAGLPKWIVGLGIGGIGLLIPLMISLTKYQGERFDAWLHAWEDPKNVGYQVVQSLYAIGDGGLFGVGIGNSKQKITHLPMSDTDYIFSIICEEFGFVGGVLVIGLYIAYAYFGVKIAMNACDKFGAYLATGVTALIILQAFVNMGVATNVLPSTGLTLPFISRGATSLAVMLCGTGILLSVSGRKRVERESNG